MNNTDAGIEHALRPGVRAPSVHSTRPWRFVAASDLLTTSRGPLVVVPRRARTASPVSANIVVALDESVTPQVALAYGHGAAGRGGTSLTIPRRVAEGNLGEAAALARARLLVACGEQHPDVDVTTEVVPDYDRDALVTASRASLLERRSRGRGLLVSALFGSLRRMRSTQPSAVALPH